MKMLREELRTHNSTIGIDGELPEWLFMDTVVYIDHPNSPNGESNHLDMTLQLIHHTLLFAGAKIAENITNEAITHVVIIISTNDQTRDRDKEKARTKHIREKLQR